MSYDISELLTRPNFTDLPLGPFAGTVLRYAKTPHGSTLHGGFQCPETHKPTATVHEFPQATSGTLADLNLPATAHCHWDEDSFAYIRAARQIADLRDQNTEASNIGWGRNVPLGPLRGGRLSMPVEPPIAGPLSALRPAWIAARDQRELAIAKIADSLKWPIDDSVALAVVARWIADGRKAREYDAQFAHFLAQVDTMLEPFGIGAGYKYRDVLTAFLDHVGHGGSAETAADLLEEKFDLRTNVPDNSLTPARTVIAHWGGMLRAIETAYRGRCLALIEYDGSWWAGASLPDMYLSLWGGARFQAAGIDWVACLVPRAHQLVLHDPHGHTSGLMLHDLWQVDVPAASTALLRHVVRERVGTHQADAVVTIPPMKMPVPPARGRFDDLDDPWHHNPLSRPTLRHLSVPAELVESLRDL